MRRTAFDRRDSISEYVIDAFVDTSRRIRLLVWTAYVAGVLGLVVSLSADHGNPSDPLVTLGIVLMFLCFLSLFSVTMTMSSL